MAVQLTAAVHAQRVSKRLGLVLFGLIALFLVLDIAISYLGLIPYDSVRGLFNLARENSLGAFFSWVQGLAVGLVAGALWWASRRKGWGVLCAFFTYLAIDDATKIHERVGSAFGSVLKGKFPSYPWQLIFVPPFAALGLYVLIHIWKSMPSRRARATCFAALTCFATAVFFDYLEGIPTLYETLARGLGVSAEFMEHFGRVLEETLELSGSSLFLMLFTAHLFENVEKLEIRFHGT